MCIVIVNGFMERTKLYQEVGFTHVMVAYPSNRGRDSVSARGNLEEEQII